MFDLFLFLDLLEPPDIRNWFSSYVYDSPVLGTNDFGDSLSKEIECENDEFDIEETNLENEETLGEYSKSKNRGVVNIGEKLHSNGFVKSKSCFMNNEQKEQSSREVLFIHLYILLVVHPFPYVSSNYKNL